MPPLRTVVPPLRMEHHRFHHNHTWPAGVELGCLHGSQADWSNATVVVPAVFREWHNRGPPEYLRQQYPVYLY